MEPTCIYLIFTSEIGSNCSASMHCRSLPPYRIGRDAARGRHLIATRDLAAGDLILEDEPLVVGPATRSRSLHFVHVANSTPTLRSRCQNFRPVCLECLRPVALATALPCPGCQFPLCGAGCSRGPLHSKKECDILGRSNRAPPTGYDDDCDAYLYASVFVLRSADVLQCRACCLSQGFVKFAVSWGAIQSRSAPGAVVTPG